MGFKSVYSDESRNEFNGQAQPDYPTPTADQEALQPPLFSPSDVASAGQALLGAAKGAAALAPVALGMFKVTSPHHGTYYSGTLEGAKKIVQDMRNNTSYDEADRIRPRIIDMDSPKAKAAHLKNMKRLGITPKE